MAQDALVKVRPEAEVERLYRQEGGKLWRGMVAYSRDRDIASDAVAEAFAQALGRADQIESFLPWLWKTAFRVATREMVGRRELPAGRVDTSYEMPEPVGDLLRGLARLSPNQRAALVLHDYADRPTAEVAETLGMSAATVRVHLSQGRRRLRKLLEVDDD